MRASFFSTLTELANGDPSILLLTGDLGFNALEGFKDSFPERFYNTGVAEQNLVGLATGLAEAGFMPFVYSITPFVVLRPYEFIRNGPIFHRLPVRIVGVGGGVEYSTNGISHYGLEDIGVMRIQPGITIVAPADGQQTRTALQKTYNLPGPIYYRLGKDDRLTVPGLEGRFELGQAVILRQGKDPLIIVIGGVTNEVVAASDILEEQGLRPTVMLVSSINPSPIDDLKQALAQSQIAITVEAHYVDGGLGSLVAEIIAESGLNCRLYRLGMRGLLDGRTGSQTYMYQKMGISRGAIVKTVKMLVEDRLTFQSD